MAEKPPPETVPDPTPTQLAQTRIDPMPDHERETYEGRIKELLAENKELKEKLEKGNAPSPLKKKKGILERFSPL